MTKIQFNDLYKCELVEHDDDIVITISKDEYNRFLQNFDNFMTLIYACKYNKFVEDQANKLYVYAKFFNM